MIAEYRDLMPGTGTALHVKKLFQDGISIAGDDVCKAIVEDIVLDQVMAQLPSGKARRALGHILIEAAPVRMGHAAARVTDQIVKHGKCAAALPDSREEDGPVHHCVSRLLHFARR